MVEYIVLTFIIFLKLNISNGLYLMLLDELLYIFNTQFFFIGPIHIIPPIVLT